MVKKVANYGPGGVAPFARIFQEVGNSEDQEITMGHHGTMGDHGLEWHVLTMQ